MTIVSSLLKIIYHMVLPDGTIVVCGSYDKTVRVWNIATGKVVKRLEDIDGVTSVPVTPDGTKVVSESDDQTVRVWKFATGEAVLPNRSDIIVCKFDFNVTAAIAFSKENQKSLVLIDSSGGIYLINFV